MIHGLGNQLTGIRGSMIWSGRVRSGHLQWTRPHSRWNKIEIYGHYWTVMLMGGCLVYVKRSIQMTLMSLYEPQNWDWLKPHSNRTTDSESEIRLKG